MVSANQRTGLCLLRQFSPGNFLPILTNGVSKPELRIFLSKEISFVDLSRFRAEPFSLRKTVGKVSPILVTLTSHSDSNFERSNISLKENKRDGVDLNSNGSTERRKNSMVFGRLHSFPNLFTFFGHPVRWRGADKCRLGSFS